MVVVLVVAMLSAVVRWAKAAVEWTRCTLERMSAEEGSCAIAWHLDRFLWVSQLAWRAPALPSVEFDVFV